MTGGINTRSTSAETDQADAMRAMADTMQALQAAVAGMNAVPPPGPTPPVAQTPRVRLHVDPPTYAGAMDVKSPSEFLEALDLYTATTGYDEGEVLLRVVPNCLQGAAARWFHFVGTFKDMAEFRASLRQEFQATDYARRLQVELDCRTQGVNEPLTEFVHCIAEYYRRMQSKATEAEKVSRVVRQCHPSYRIYLRGKTFATLKELAAEAKDIQSDFLACAMYRPPPLPMETLEPTLAYGAIGPDPVANSQQGPAHYSMAAAASPSMTAFPSAGVGLAALDPYSYFRVQRQAMADAMSHNPKPERVQAPPPNQGAPRNTNNGERNRRCWTCDGLGHLSRVCPSKQGNGSSRPAHN